MNRIQLPDSIGINEVRIYKDELANIPVRKCYFAPNSRYILDAISWKEGYVPVYSGPNCVYLISTKRDATSLPTEINIEISRDLDRFCELPSEIARRFVFAMLRRSAQSVNYYKSVGWQIFSLKTRFRYGHYAVNVDIRDEKECYAIYLDPTTLVLMPVTEVCADSLWTGRPLMKLVPPSYYDQIKEWRHSIYPSRVGYFAEIQKVQQDLAQIQSNDVIKVKAARTSRNLTEYPAFALRIIATLTEIEVLNLSVSSFRELHPLSSNRLKETKQWVAKLFPGDLLVVNDREIHIENRVTKFQKMSQYCRRNTQPTSQLWYRDVQLLFDSLGTKTDYSQRNGLRKYTPFDENSRNRPFDKIKPYVIMPGDLAQATLYEFLDYLENGYTKRQHTTSGDDSFEGMKDIFKVDFTPPDEDDIVFLDEGSLQEYEQAARTLLRRWAVSENKDKNRIVIVVIPEKFTIDDSHDPYIPLKRLFIEEGLPSQMLEIGHLRDLGNVSLGYGYLLWNFALDLYVKLGGKPWTLAQQINNVHCLIGMGFGSTPENSLYVGIANVFDENGQWLSFASEDKELTEEERESLRNLEHQVIGTSSYKLHQDLTSRIINDSLEVYSLSSNANVATKVVLHKNGKVYAPEALGFLQALSSKMLDGARKLSGARFALVSIIKDHNLRLYGPLYSELPLPMRNTVSRGAVQILDENTAVIATTGKNHMYYPGIGTPKPILLERYVPSEEVLKSTGFDIGQIYSIEEICEQVLALTQLHWGSIGNIRLPVTSEYAQRIANFVARSRVTADMLLKLKRLWWI